jgi:hypothetical protein
LHRAANAARKGDWRKKVGDSSNAPDPETMKGLPAACAKRRACGFIAGLLAARTRSASL